MEKGRENKGKITERPEIEPELPVQERKKEKGTWGGQKEEEKRNSRLEQGGNPKTRGRTL